MHQTLRRYFSDSGVSMVHQNGSKTSAERGLEVVFYARENETVPCLAELVSKAYGARIGLTFEGKNSIDFDDTFRLPPEVVYLLREICGTMPEELLG